MSYRIFLFLCFLIFVGCTKEDTDIELIGKWKLVQTLADPGDGSGVFQDIKSEKSIAFFTDSSFVCNEKLCFSDATSSKGTFDISHLYIEDCIDEVPSKLNYKQQGDFLLIYFPCIEPCAEKYKKLD